MASWIVSWFSFIWPFSTYSRDLSTSHKLVQPLPLQPSTKRFVLALRDPDDPSSVVYVLSSLVLSERSASDARDLVNALNPKAVVAQVASEAIEEIQNECQISVDSATISSFPTSSIGVIMESFLDGTIRSKYDSLAATQVMRIIFGTSFYGHVVAAKEAAKKSNSAFYYLESPLKHLNGTDAEQPTEASEERRESVNTHRDYSKFLPGSAKLTGLSCTVSAFGTPGVHRRFAWYSDLAQLKSVLPYSAASLQDGLATRLSTVGIREVTAPINHADVEFECPAFAVSFYPLLTDLNLLWGDLPGMNVALQNARKLLMDVDKGMRVDYSDVALSQSFRLAVEGLRVALNAAARSPLKQSRSSSGLKGYDDLPYEEKCYALLAQALKQQARKSETVVAILDASIVAGIRKHWNTPVPNHVAVFAAECLILDETKEETELADCIDGLSNSKGKLLDKQVVVVGAGAAAAVGLASFSHLGPVSTVMKIFTFKIPTIVKLSLMQTQRSAAVAIAKMVSPMTKVIVPAVKSFAPSKFAVGTKASAMKAASGTGKIRAAAHSVVASAERASLSAIRTAFYNVMWNRRHNSFGVMPWLMFGGSVSGCALLLTYGNAIENAIESVPEAPAIARLGRGLRNLFHASEMIKQSENNQYWESMYYKLYELVHKKM